MRLPRVRFTVRRMMVAVAIVAACIGAIRWATLFLEDLTYHGPHTSLLPAGRLVVVVRDLRAPAALEAFEGYAEWGRWRFPTELALALEAGTPCIVRVDSAWDVDSCVPRRQVCVRVVQGEHKGAVVAVPRQYLRRP